MQQRALAEPEVDRRFDILLLFGAFFVIAAAGHLNNMLLSGDWDFWTDWKDRLWWPTVGPIAAIIIPSALQYIVWAKLRLPIGATLTVVAVLFGQWVDRIVNFTWWAGFPLNFVWPATMIPAAIFMDVFLMWTNSFVLTSLVGSFAWGLLFYPSNWPMLVPFLQPVDYHGYVLTLADVQGFEVLRTQTPEYVRLVEQGNLRAFLQQISYVSAFFAGMMSIGTYWIGQLIGRYLAVWPATKFLKQT